MADETEDGVYGECAEPHAMRVARGFETSRLEEELLALAYERVVPVCTRTSGARARGSLEDIASVSRYYSDMRCVL